MPQFMSDAGMKLSRGDNSILRIINALGGNSLFLILINIQDFL
jgi:hypothetical protein